jgi:hypothetical protein
VIAALFVFGAVGADAAQKGAADVEVTIDATTSSLKGKVSSSKDDCKSNVKVNLFWKHDGLTDKVARQNTTNAGRYEIEAPGGDVPGGKYFSRVPAKTGCKAAESETIRVRNSD